MKNNIKLSTARLASAVTILSAGMLSGIGSAEAVDLVPLSNSRFDFGSAGNILATNNVFDFTNNTNNPPTPTPGVPGTIEITNAAGGSFIDIDGTLQETGGFFDLFAGGTDDLSGATGDILDVGFGFPIENGVRYDIPRIEGFYRGFTDAADPTKPVNIRFDATSFEARFNEIAGEVNSLTFNIGGFIVDEDGTNSLANYQNAVTGEAFDPNELPVVFNFTTITGQVPQSPQPEEWAVVDLDSEVVLDIPDISELIDKEQGITTSFSGTVTTVQAQEIPEPMTMLGSAVALGFGYFSKKRRSSK